MSKLLTYTFTHRVASAPKKVWDLIADHEGMPGWLPVRKAVLEQAGSPDRNGVGAVRKLVLAGPPIRERITVFDPPTKLGYTAVSGIPARDYNGEIVIKPDGDGSQFTWTISFRPLFPGVQFVLRTVIWQSARALAKTAGRAA
jgi:hypothetical protein